MKFGLMSRIGSRGWHPKCRPKMRINKYILHFEPNLEPYNIQKKKLREQQEMDEVSVSSGRLTITNDMSHFRVRQDLRSCLYKRQEELE